MSPADHRRSSSTSSTSSVTLSLDPSGHIRDPLCSWAPPPLSLPDPTHGQHRPLFGPTIVSTSEVCLVCLDDDHYHTHDACDDPSHGPTRPLIVENFPPLYPLPNRSSRNYEVECLTHSCAAEEIPIKNTPRAINKGATTSTGSSGGDATASTPGTGTRPRGNTLEDQRRIQHLRLIYGSAGTLNGASSRPDYSFD